jgi:hypothetical protein
MSNGPRRLLLRVTLNRDDVLFFQHIPNTGGLSLIAFLDSQFAEDEIFPLHSAGSEGELSKFTPEQLQRFRLIRGHFRFGPYDNGIYRYLAQNPIRITFLREPVSRTISAYHHQRRIRKFGEETTLEDFLTDPQYARCVANLQTRLIVGEIKAAAAGGMDKDRLPDSVLLQIAKENLEFMAFVGLTEQFRASMQLLCYTFDWRMPRDIPQINASPEPFDPSTLPPSTLERLKEKTRLDAELYEFATGLFQARHRQMVDDLVEENYSLRNPNAKEPAPLVATVLPPITPPLSPRGRKGVRSRRRLGAPLSLPLRWIAGRRPAGW